MRRLLQGGMARSFVLLLILAACTGLASASTVAYSAAFTFDGSSTYTATLPKFNSALGTLTGVKLYFRAVDAFSTFELKNNDATEMVLNVGVTVNMTKNFANTATAADKFNLEILQVFDTGIGTNLGSCATTGGAPTVVLPGDCTALTIPGLGTTTYPAFTIANTDANYRPPIDPTSTIVTGTGVLGVFGAAKTSSSIASYVGGPASTFNLSTQPGFTVSYDAGGNGTPNVTLSTVSVISFTGEVDYTYNIVPEPNTIGLAIGGGILLLLGMRRSRKA